MSKALVSVPESMFGGAASRANYICLTARTNWCKMADGTQIFGRLFRQIPKTLLDIPSDRQEWRDDFDLSPDDFMPRAVAFCEAASKNAKELLDPFDDGTPERWTLVFRLGAWDGGYLHVSGGDCHVYIESDLQLVRPTKEEIKQFGSDVPGKVGAA